MQLYLRLLKYLRPYWMRLAVAVVCSGLVAAFTSAYAWLVRPVLDEVFINRNVTWLALLAVALIVVSSLKGVASFWQTYLMVYVGRRVLTDILHQLLVHLISLHVFFHVRDTSTLNRS